MNVGKLIWAAVSTALAFGLNLQLHPRYVADYERSESPAQAGVLAFSDPSLELPTLAAHVLVEDIVHFGKRYEVRELSLRSVNARGTVPSFEVFAALPSSTGATPGRRLDPNGLLQLELAVQPTGRLGARSSFVQQAGAEPGQVLTGTLQFTDIRETYDSGQPELHGEARLELQVERGRGVQMVTGRWSGRLVLD